MRRAVVLGALFVLGLALALWLAGEDREDPAASTATDRGGQDVSADAPVEEPPTLPEPERASDAEARAVVTGADGQEAGEARSADPLPSPAPDGTLRARVRTSAGAPAPGLRVQLRVAMAGAPLPLVAEQATTDEDGLAVLLEGRSLSFEDGPEDFALDLFVDVPVEPPVSLAVTPEELRAAQASGDVLELHLPPGAEVLGGPFLVQVLDARGAPAFGVEVGYRLQARGAADTGDDVVEAVTEAPDGLARLDLAEVSQLRSYFAATRQPYERVVSCRGPLLDPPAAVLGDDPVAQPVELRLGPTFALDVELVGPDGARIRAGGAVQLSWTRPGEQQRDGFRWLAVEDGRATVEHVSCGLGVSLGASVRDSLYRGVGYELERAPAPGERVQVTLRFEDSFPVLAGRLVDAAGDPVADQRFTLELVASVPPPDRRGPTRFGGSFHGTGADGTFELPWGDAAREPLGSGTRMLRFVEQAGRSGAPEGWSPRWAEVPAPLFDANATRFEVGDVELAPQPLLVAGQVVDEAGEPFHARVRVRYAVQEGERTEWYNHGEVPYTDRQGRFELRTFQPYAAIRVAAFQNAGGGSEELEVPLGTDDVRLVFLPPEPESARGKLHGRLLADEEVPWGGLSVRLSREGQRGGRDSMVFAGRYELSRLQPGTYALEVVADGHGFDGPDFVFAREEGLLVAAGETTLAPDVDLRGRLRYWELTVLDPEGERVDRTSCRVATDLARHAGGWVEDGRLAFVSPLELDAFTLFVDGFEPLDVAATGAPQTLRLVRR